MNSRINGRSRIHVTTLGCSKNLYDSEILEGQISRHGGTLVDTPETADVIVINTCGFIEMAKDESIAAILEAEQLKKQDPSKKLVVCGCLSQRYAQQLKEELPAVDAFFGTEDFAGVLQFLKFPAPRQFEYLYEDRLVSTPSHYAYLKISEGCNHTCAFCAIPAMRGRHRSRPIEQIVAEATMLAERGVKELILISQDTTFYGLDLYRSQRICHLLRALEDIEPIRWIRLHYLYPTTVQDRLLDYIAGSGKVVPYLDMPIQHITDRMLKLMKRGGSSKRILQIFERARRRIPGVYLRTTLIVGHPGETNEDFRALKQLIQEMRFDRLGVFKYSNEENTPAFTMDQLDSRSISSRYSQLMRIQRDVSLRKNQEKVGNSLPVLVDGIDWQTMTAVGRTAGDSPDIDNSVVIQNLDSALAVGEFVKVKINDATEYELYGNVEA